MKAKRMSGMERLQRMFAGVGGVLGHPPPDSPTLDSSEQDYISSLAFLKMLKHGARVSGSEYTYFRSLVVDSTASAAMLDKWRSDATIIMFRNQWAKSDDLLEIDHVCSAKYESLIYQGISQFPITLESL